MVRIIGTPPEVGWVLQDPNTERLWKVMKLEPTRNELGDQTSDAHWGVQLRGGSPSTLWSGEWIPNGKLTALPVEGAVLRVTSTGRD
jgi:hypothetical protein